MVLPDKRWGWKPPINTGNDANIYWIWETEIVLIQGLKKKIQPSVAQAVQSINVNSEGDKLSDEINKGRQNTEVLGLKNMSHKNNKS